jgi:hypothetical protein
MRKLFASTLLILAAGLAQAEEQRVQVQLRQHRAFADFGRSQWDRERKREGLARPFRRSLSQPIADGPSNFALRCKDINLAGELEWMFGYTQRDPRACAT